MAHQVDMEVGGEKLILETGRMAKQADGAVLARYGETLVLATVVSSTATRPNADFLPLTVDYQEKYYASGKIPGGFFRREGRPTEKEVLTSRLIDRPLRPLFPKGFFQETQIIVSVLSADSGNATDLLGIIGASAALLVSDVSFRDPVAAVRVGRIHGEHVINPDLDETEKSDFNLVVAGTADAVMMVEGMAKEIPEEVLVASIERAHGEIKRIVEIQRQLSVLGGKAKKPLPVVASDAAFAEEIKRHSIEAIREVIRIPHKLERKEKLNAIVQNLLATFSTTEKDRSKEITDLFKEMERQELRERIITMGVRADGRSPAEIRPITCEVGILPRSHGSALFTRGETQSLAVVTLGTADDEQKIDALEGEWYKTFMLHYNFPPFSVGETRPMRGPGRREIGHGVLAERGLKCVLPGKEEFPYTVRIVSDILESNGSSSMATVCGGTLALMDAGVPIKAPVAGIAMGLIKEGDAVVILSDILGLEDHLGDMDFKTTGTEKGITAFQMDTKIPGMTADILRQALEQARVGRLYILSKMVEVLPAPRQTLSAHAPRITTLMIKQSKIGEVIGPGGKTIRSIIEKTGVKINVDDSGLVTIASTEAEAAARAVEMIKKITEEVEVGKVYVGKVKRIMDFGAIVEILPNADGLVHISQLAHERVRSVSDIVSMGDEIMVKVLEVDRQGKIRLSRKDALKTVDEDQKK